ncbi:hypothetical protein QFZ35_000159 [Arthrobacter ulcerisalmonis]|nr:YtxH domain-containing protein [Arthrobacter ulcerisalmonis]MDQ0661661.1 hypothetical protein [Arthrobacter ulcerisalmonis]
MKNKLIFVSGVAVGYVLGTRAGRDSYEKLKLKVRGFWESQTVQDKVSGAAQTLETNAPGVREQASQALKKAKEEITGTLQHDARTHIDQATPLRSPHDQTMADGSEGAFYGTGGPASGESLEAETAPQADREANAG